MKLNKFSEILKRIVAILIIFTFVFQFESKATLAATQLLTEEQKNEILDWVNNNFKGKITKYSFDDGKEESERTAEDYVYAVNLPNNEGNIGYNAQNGSYYYEVRDTNTNNVVAQIPFNIEILISSEGEPFNEAINENNYKNYLAFGQSNIVLETEENEFIKRIQETEYSGRQLILALEFNDNTYSFSDIENVNVSANPKGVWDSIVDWATGIFDVQGAVAKIINELLIGIANSIHKLVNFAVGIDEGEYLTVYDVIFGDFEKLSINFWGDASSQIGNNHQSNANSHGDDGMIDNAPSTTLKRIVEYWYGAFRGIAIVVYLVMLLYIGIKILLSSTAGRAQKYKDMFTSWIVGIILLVFFPYAMKYIVLINDVFVETIDQDILDNVTDNEFVGTDTMIKIKNQAEKESNIALTVVYIVMLGQLIVLVGVYYKRAFTMAFLITIFPVVTILYIWEKTNGNAKALTTWTKEYMVLVLTQTFHATIYVIFIEGAYSAFLSSGNWFIFILCVTFLFKAEGIVRSIFDMKSSANTIGDLAKSGAAAWAATKGIKKVFKRDTDTKNKDDSDLAEAEQELQAAKQHAMVSRIANNSGGAYAAISGGRAAISGGSSGGGSGSGSGGSSGTQMASEAPMANIEAAQALMRVEALKKKGKKGVISRAINFTGKAAGVTLGVTSGLAKGSVKDGFTNTILFTEMTGALSKGVNAIGGYTYGAYAGRRMRRKVISGKMDDKLREIGFDFGANFDSNPNRSAIKAQIIREALAAQMSATRRAGKEIGDIEFVDAIEKGEQKYGYTP